jgi:UDP-galactopyranose mutase
MQCDYLIVGSGLFGSIIAERIAGDLGKHVIVIDRRDHIGGNCYSCIDAETGIEYHRYGTHVFHTDSPRAWRYIRQFTEFNGYHHQVLTKYNEHVYQMPINLETINCFYGRSFSPRAAKAFIAKEIGKENIEHPRNLEEKAIASIGRPLYEAFIRGYTMKQWGKDPKELPASIVDRIPIRFDYREDYFHNCRWQGIPMGGYTRVFKKMLSSPKIEVKLNCDYFQNRHEFEVRAQTIFTGRLDHYFDLKLGALDWRSVDFRREVVPDEDFQGTSVMNFAEARIPYTRIHEPRHLHPERDHPSGESVIFYETSHASDNHDSYYPLNDERNRALKAQYLEEAQKETNVIFGGRLGQYAYYDMDRTILAALDCYQQQILTKL